eukprot:g16758.t1
MLAKHFLNALHANDASPVSATKDTRRKFRRRHSLSYKQIDALDAESGEAEERHERPACFLAKCGTCFAKMFTKVEYTALLMCGVGMLLVMISVMIRWRLDEHGVTPLQNVWSIATFEQKSYGLLSVRAREYRSWTIITQEMCDWTGMKGGQIASFAQAIINGGGCDGPLSEKRRVVECLGVGLSVVLKRMGLDA